jgi:hypothetical protein
MTAIHRREVESKRRRRRKPLIYTVSTPTKRLTPPQKRRIRSVYILARPIKKAGQLGFLSEGKFPLCHWGLLVSPYNQREMQDHIRQGTQSWGTIFEISLSLRGTHIPNIHTYSARTFSGDWQYACIAYVGETYLPNYRIFTFKSRENYLDELGAAPDDIARRGATERNQSTPEN